MKIAIEAQRIFRRDKHGMDFVVLEVLGNFRNGKMAMSTMYLLLPVKIAASKNQTISTSSNCVAPPIPYGNRLHYHELYAA